MGRTFFCFFLVFQFATFGHAQNVGLKDSSDKNVEGTFSNEFRDEVNFGLVAPLSGRISLSYGRVLTERWEIRGAIGGRLFPKVPVVLSNTLPHPVYPLFVIIPNGFYSEFFFNGHVQVNYHFNYKEYTQYFFSFSLGYGLANRIYVEKEIRCDGPSGCTACCQQVPVKESRETEYLYGSIGGGMNIPLNDKFFFVGELKVGVLWALGEDHYKIQSFGRSLAWFGSAGVGYHF